AIRPASINSPAQTNTSGLSSINGQASATNSCRSARLKAMQWSVRSKVHDHRRIGLVVLGHQPHAVHPLAAVLDELAALVLVDGPGNAVREKPMADGPRVHGFFPCLPARCSGRRRSFAVGIPRRVLITRTAPAVRPIRNTNAPTDTFPGEAELAAPSGPRTRLRASQTSGKSRRWITT